MKISRLPVASALSDDDEVVVYQGGATKRAPKSALGGGLGTLPSGNEGDVIGLDGAGGLENVGPMVPLPDPISLTVGDMLFWSGTEFVRVPAGTAEGQLLTWSSGAPAWTDPAGGGGVFDPAALNASHAFRASYAGLPWTGFATAGLSGTRSLDTASGGAADPTVGAAVNGFTPAVFNTAATSAHDSTTPLSSLITAGAYTILMVVKPTGSAAAPNASRLSEKAVLAEFGSGGAYLGIGYSTDGFSAYHYDGTDWSGPAAAAALSSWHVVVARFGSGTLGISVDGGAENTTAKSNVADDPGANATSRMLLGLNYAGTGGTGQTMEVLEYWILPSRISDSDAAEYVAYAQARYGI